MKSKLQIHKNNNTVSRLPQGPQTPQTPLERRWGRGDMKIEDLMIATQIAREIPKNVSIYEQMPIAEAITAFKKLETIIKDGGGHDPHLSTITSIHVHLSQAHEQFKALPLTVFDDGPGAPDGKTDLYAFLKETIAYALTLSIPKARDCIRGLLDSMRESDESQAIRCGFIHLEEACRGIDSIQLANSTNHFFREIYPSRDEEDSGFKLGMDGCFLLRHFGEKMSGKPHDPISSSDAFSAFWVLMLALEDMDWLEGRLKNLKQRHQTSGFDTTWDTLVNMVHDAAFTKKKELERQQPAQQAA
jgi:hypothetical protein